MTALMGFPTLRLWPGGLSPGITNFTLSSSTSAIEFIFQNPFASPITRFGFRQTSINGVAPVFKGSLQGVDSTGIPDGTIKGGGSPASATFTPTAGQNGTFVLRNFDNAYTPSVGERLALVIGHDSGTIDGGNFVLFSTTNAIGIIPGSPYSITNSSGTRTKGGATPCFAIGTATELYGFPTTSVTNASFAVGSTPDERGLLLTLPTTMCATYKIAGVDMYATMPVGGTFDLVLYQGTTVLQTESFDTDHWTGLASGRANTILFSGTLATLNAGTSYRLVLKPTSGTFALSNLITGTAAELDAHPYGSAIAQGTSRTDGGAFTDSDVQRYAMNPILSDMTLPTSTSGARLIGPSALITPGGC